MIRHWWKHLPYHASMPFFLFFLFHFRSPIVPLSATTWLKLYNSWHHSVVKFGEIIYSFRNIIAEKLMLLLFVRLSNEIWTSLNKLINWECFAPYSRAIIPIRCLLYLFHGLWNFTGACERLNQIDKLWKDSKWWNWWKSLKTVWKWNTYKICFFFHFL